MCEHRTTKEHNVLTALIKPEQRKAYSVVKVGECSRGDLEPNSKQAVSASQGSFSFIVFCLASVARVSSLLIPSNTFQQSELIFTEASIY